MADIAHETRSPPRRTARHSRASELADRAVRGRIFSFRIHRAVEFLLALALIAGPFLLDLNGSAVFVSVILGAITLGISLTGFAGADRPIGLAEHEFLDRVLVVLLIASVLGFVIAGEGAEAAFLAAVAIVEVALLAWTRYSRT